MPKGAVTLADHDPEWAIQAAREAARLRAAAPGALEAVHHVGSTSVAGLAAKPILDLLGVGVNLDLLDGARGSIEALGYEWRGEYGLTGRRYYRMDDPDTGARRVHLHCYASGHPAVARHLAFRDLLRRDQRLAAGYEREKRRCAALHPEDGGAYSACKGVWIRRVEAEPSRGGSFS